MSTPQILYRQLDKNYEPRYGQSQSDYISDITAVGQAVMTRLKMFEGEWWANLDDGLPLWQKILGVGGAGSNLSAINLLIVQRILGTPFVTSVANIASQYLLNTRTFQFYCEVHTQFGTLVIANYPTPPSRALPPGV